MSQYFNPFNAYDIENYEIDGWCPHCVSASKFAVAEECYCNVAVDGAGYTHSDEYGDCSYCDQKPAVCMECGLNCTLEEIEDHGEGKC